MGTLERSAERLLSRGSTITSPLLAQCRCPSAVDTHARQVEAFNSGSVETVLGHYEPGAAFVARNDERPPRINPRVPEQCLRYVVEHQELRDNDHFLRQDQGR